MSKNKVLDTALALIDENIHEVYQEICRRIYAETTYCDQDFNKFLAVTTSGRMTLHDYIRKRKLFFAARELVNSPEKRVTDIAADYNYESSSFTRAIKVEYGKSPKEIRAIKMQVPDNRLNADDMLSAKSRLDAVMDKVAFDAGNPTWADWNYFEAFTNATEEYGFDISTCQLISELSEKLGVPFNILLEKCFDMMIDYLPEKGDLPEKYEYIIDLGICNDVELNAILKYYNCEYYEISNEMVAAYRNKML